MDKTITLIKMFRIQASVAMNLFIFLPIFLYTHDLVISLLNTLPFIIMISGEIALNDCCDIKKDKINKPDRPLVAGNINVLSAYKCVGIVLSISITLAIIIYSSSVNRLVIFLLALIILSLYNLPLRWIALVKTFITAFCTVICLMFICTFIYVDVSYVLFLISAFLFITGRELMMDIRDIEGDKKQGYITIAVKLGKKTTSIISLILIFLSNLVCGIYVRTNNITINYYLLTILILTECLVILIYFYKKKNAYRNKAIILLWIPMIIMLVILLLSLTMR